MFLLGLHGPAQSGKDTAFAVIEKVAAEAGFKASRRGFADKLKLSAMRMFKPDATVEEAIAWADHMKFHGSVMTFTEGEPEYVDIGVGMQQVTEAPLEPEFQITGRQLLQHFGTEAHRDVFGANFWVDALLPVGVIEGGFKLMDNVNLNIAADPADMKWVHNFADDVVGPLPHIAVITDVRFENECDRIHDLGGEVWRINRVDLPQGDTHASEARLADHLIDREVENGYGVDTYCDLIAALTKKYILPERKDVATQ